MKITYIANDGFLVTTSKTKLLIDSLFGHVRNSVVIEAPSEELIKQMEEAYPPFDGLDLITASHAHWDHFEAVTVLKCLDNNRKAAFISTGQAMQSLKELNASQDLGEKQLITVEAKDKNKACFTVNGIEVKALMLDHSPYFIEDQRTGKKFNKHENVQNLGFIFDIDGYKIYHCGDADIFNENEYVKYSFEKESFEVAFLDRSMLLSDDRQGLAILAKYIKSKYIVLMHTTTDERDLLLKLVKEFEGELSQIIIFGNSMESIEI